MFSERKAFVMRTATFFVAGFLSLFAFLSSARADLDDIVRCGELRHIGVVYANFVTKSGGGFDVELMQGFARSLGVKYTLVFSDFRSVLQDLLGREVAYKDGKVVWGGEAPVQGDIISTGLTKLPWREEVVDFSDPVVPSQVLLVVRADAPFTPIKGGDSLQQDISETTAMIGTKRLLVMRGTCLDPSAYGLKNEGIDVRTLGPGFNLNEIVPALINGDADFALLDVPNVILDLQKWSGKIKVLGPVSNEQVLATAFPKNAPKLRKAFNDYLAKIKESGQYDRMIEKYYPGLGAYFPTFFPKDK